MAKAIRASVLVLLFTCSAQAGWIQNEAPAPPPPSPQTSAVQEPTNVVQEPTAGGEILNENLMLTALELLAVLPALL